MAQWTHEEQLAFDIAFGLKKVTIPGFRKALKEEDRFKEDDVMTNQEIDALADRRRERQKAITYEDAYQLGYDSFRPDQKEDGFWALLDRLSRNALRAAFDGWTTAKAQALIVK